ncbi:hypothetical protein Q6255_25665, partial [Klebsiella pneumoniae]|uniref:hypothetical protein n=1 Tax=Klebsiella pneumoniae TaxID=573 RepID=UPI00272FFCCD
MTISRLVSRQAAISTRYLPFHVILHANTSDGPMIDNLTPGDALYRGNGWRADTEDLNYVERENYR